MGDPKLSDLFKVYHDLERTLTQLRKNAERHLHRDIPIDVKKLIRQLSRSKQKLERKIGNTILLEKQQFGRKFRQVVISLKKTANNIHPSKDNSPRP